MTENYLEILMMQIGQETHFENQVNQVNQVLELQICFPVCDEKQGILCNKTPFYIFGKLYGIQRDLYHESGTRRTLILGHVSSLWEVL